MHSSIYFRKCVCNQQSTVEIQRSQQSKPHKSAWSTVKRRKELVKVL